MSVTPSPTLVSLQDGAGPVQTGTAGGGQSQGLSVRHLSFYHLAVCNLSVPPSVSRRGDHSWPQSAMNYLKLRNGEDRCVLTPQHTLLVTLSSSTI